MPYFLKIDDVEGGSTAPRHFGEIEITSYSFGAKQAQKMYALGALSDDEVGTNLKNDFTFSKTLDKASPILMEACMTGRRFNQATVTMESTSEQSGLLGSNSFRLQNLTVSSFQTGYDGSSEMVTLEFEKTTKNSEQLADE